MAQIKWQQMQNPNFAAANTLLTSGADTVSQGIKNLQDTAIQFGETQKANEELQRQQNTAQFQLDSALARTEALRTGQNPNQAVNDLVKQLESYGNVDKTKVAALVDQSPLTAVTLAKSNQFLESQQADQQAKDYLSNLGLGLPSAATSTDSQGMVNELRTKAANFNSQVAAISQDDSLSPKAKDAAIAQLNTAYQAQSANDMDYARTLQATQQRLSQPSRVVNTRLGGSVIRTTRPSNANAGRELMAAFKAANPLAEGQQYTPEQVESLKADLLSTGVKSNVTTALLKSDSAFTQASKKPTSDKLTGTELAHIKRYDEIKNTFVNPDGSMKDISWLLANPSSGFGELGALSSVATALSGGSDRKQAAAARELQGQMGNMAIALAKQAGASGINTKAEFDRFASAMPTVDYSTPDNMKASLQDVFKYVDNFQADLVSRYGKQNTPQQPQQAPQQVQQPQQQQQPTPQFQGMSQAEKIAEYRKMLNK